MTPLEQRGRRLFILLAILITLDKLPYVGFALIRGFAEMHWLMSVAIPVGFVTSFLSLWRGDIMLRRGVGIACALTGAVPLMIATFLTVTIAMITPPEATWHLAKLIGLTMGPMCAIGLSYFAIGWAVNFMPSLTAFFDHQLYRHAIANFLKVIP